MAQPDTLDEAASAMAAPIVAPLGLAAELHGSTIGAAGFAGGIAIGLKQPWPLIWPWIAAAVMATVIAAWGHRRHPRASAIVLGFACLALGAAWVAERQFRVAADDLIALMPDDPCLVSLEGVAVTAPETRVLNAGSLGVFDFRPPVSAFRMQVDGLVSREGQTTPVRGRVAVRVDEVVAPFLPGDRLRVSGWLHRPREPHNPGEFNYVARARALGQAGLVTTTSRDLVRAQPPADADWWMTLRRWHDGLQARAGAWLLAGLPETNDARSPPMLANLLLGQREGNIDGIEDAFERIGLAHLLAISGAHLAVVVGLALFLLRWGGRERRWHAWLVIALVAGYLVLIEVRVPVARAAVMTIAACVGLLAGRRLRLTGLLEVSAIMILLWQPEHVFDAGFQLSFGVVLGLMHLAPLLRERWFGPPSALAGSTGEMLGQCARGIIAAAITAWAVATPLQIHHFGFVSPLGAPLTLLMLPLVSLILVVGYLKMAIAVLLPSVSLLIGPPLANLADALVHLVAWCDRLPGSALATPFGSGPWCGLALLWVVAWACHQSRRSRRLLQAAFAALVLWLLWPMLPIRAVAGLRIDMLSVSNGSCFVLRSGGDTIVFDAGSSPDLDIGRRSIVPAVRRLGVRSIDQLIISHANIDHYASVLELADTVTVVEVIVTPQFMRTASADPHGPVAMLLQELAAREVPVRAVARGESAELGSAKFTWLHPDAEREYARVNDASMVVRVEVAGRAVLLTSDIQREAMAELMALGVGGRASILEQPHHGAYHDLAVEFLRRFDPSIVLQSTGSRRLEPDRWAEPLAHVERLITARDGACWVEVAADGEITFGRFLEADADAAP
jgi:competence protein ComEC